MSFWKKNGKVFISVSFGIFVVVQQFAVHYRRMHASKTEVIDTNGNDKIANYEISQLEKLWREADFENLVAVKNLGDPRFLKEAHNRLKKIEKGIYESESRVSRATGKRRDFFQKVHTYYRHSTSALSDLVDFLLAKQATYSVEYNTIHFDHENDGTRFKALLECLSLLAQEKQELDTFISNHNLEVQPSPISR